MPTLISSKNIVQRIKIALDTLSKADPDLMELRERMGEHNWSRFTSHSAGWILSSLLNSEPIGGLNENI